MKPVAFQNSSIELSKKKNTKKEKERLLKEFEAKNKADRLVAFLCKEFKGREI